MRSILGKIKKFWFVFLILGGVLIVSFIFIQRRALPVQRQIPTSSLNYKNIKPGITPFSETKEILGEPNDTETSSGVLVYKFDSGIPNLPHELVLKNDTVALFIEKVGLAEEKYLTDYTTLYGNPSLVKYPTVNYGLYIFLNQGVAIFAHLGSGIVEEIWYFQPTTINDLLEIAPLPLADIPIEHEAP